LRLNGDTDAIFDSYSRVSLKKGGIWVDKTYSSSCDSDFSVFVKDVLVKPVCGVFDVSFYGEKQIARTISGAMEVDVYSRNGGVIVDHVQIKEGEQAVFDNEKLERFWLFQAPNVVEAMGDDFKNLSWYVWNIGQAEVVGQSVADEGEETVFVSEVTPVVESVSVEETPVEEPVINLGEFKDPIITEIAAIPWDYSMFDEGIEIKDALSIKIVGKAYGAEKVFVNNYQLQKFTSSSGEETFTYWLEEKYGNLKAGENVYEVYSTAPDGTRSNSVYFKVIYTPPAVEPFVE
jgi:hypothetical protein